MSSRQAIPVVAVALFVAAGAVAGWFLGMGPDEVPPPVESAPVVTAAEEVAVDIIPPPREIPPGPDAEFRATLQFVQSVAIHPDPRIAEAESKAVLERITDLKAYLRDQLPADAAGRPRVEWQLKELATEEAKYQQRLARASDAWLNSRAELAGRVVETTDVIASANRRALRAAARNTNPDAAAPAIAALAHLRQTQLEARFHRVIGKDHGSVGELVTDVMLVDAAVERLEAIDDGERGAADVYATWRGELAARFAKHPKDVTPPEVAAWLLAGCYREAKANGLSGADFAFLDPARNPDLVKAAASRPFRRLVQEWSANHDRDPAATAAATALLKAAEK